MSLFVVSVPFACVSRREKNNKERKNKKCKKKKLILRFKNIKKNYYSNIYLLVFNYDITVL